MKILLLGAGGQVGWELQRALAPLGEVVACDIDSPAERRIDFAAPDGLAALVDRVRPGCVVNAAAYTAVDRAETDPATAEAVNAAAPAVLARHLAAAGVPLVHYGTDYVFDGSGTHARDEDAATGPLNVYGRTKLAGEDAIRAAGGVHLILRTSWVYAARGGNFARTMLRLAGERDRLDVIDDQIGAPTGADLLADVTAHALRRLQAEPAVGGTYHCTAGGQTSWHGYARQVVEAAHAHGLALRCAPDAVHAVPTSHYPTPAKRPLNSRLDTRRLRETFGLRLPPWEQGVQRLLDEILPPSTATPAR